MRIRSQLALAIGASVAGSFALGSVIAGLAASGIIARLVAENHGRHSSLFGPVVGAALQSRRPDVVESYIKSLMQSPGIPYAFIEDRAGNISLHNSPEFTGRKAADFLRSLDKAIIDGPSPVIIGGKQVATAHVGRIGPLDVAIRHNIQGLFVPPFLVFGTGALLVMIAFALAISRLMAKPVQRLTEAARAVAQGEFSVQLPPSSADEIRELTSSFNEMVRRLKALDEFKDQFIASVSHDLRNPMTAIRMYAENLLNDDDDRETLTEGQKKKLLTIRENAGRLNVFVSNILDAAKLKAGRIEYDIRPVDARWVSADVLELYRVMAHDSGIALKAELPDGLPAIRADPVKLEQAISNVLANAIRFTESGGRVTLAAKPFGDGVEIAVSDTGRGIKTADLERLFQPFQQVHGAKGGGGGTGLGLFIVKQSIEGMGGRVVLESQWGRGTVVRLRLPGAPEQPV